MRAGRWRKLVPNSGNWPRAPRARAVPDAHGADSVSGALDQQLAATGTPGIFPVADTAWKIAGVNEVQSFGFPHLCRAKQRADRSIIRICHLVVLMKCRDMPGDVRRYSCQKLRYIAKLLVAVVEPGNQQRHDFQPESHHIQPLNRIEDVVEHSSELAIIPILKTLEVDLVEIHPWFDVFENLRRAVAVRNIRRLQAFGARNFEDLDSPLAGDQRFVVRACHNAGAVLQRQRYELFRCEPMGRSNRIGIAYRLRCDPILAIRAMEVAAEHTEAHRQRSRQRMEERLLLDRVELERAYISVWNQQPSTAIEADPANAVQAIENDAAVAAGKTAQPAV